MEDYKHLGNRVTHGVYLGRLGCIIIKIFKIALERHNDIGNLKVT